MTRSRTSVIGTTIETVLIKCDAFSPSGIGARVLPGVTEVTEVTEEAMAGSVVLGLGEEVGMRAGILVVVDSLDATGPGDKV